MQILYESKRGFGGTAFPPCFSLSRFIMASAERVASRPSRKLSTSSARSIPEPQEQSGSVKTQPENNALGGSTRISLPQTQISWFESAMPSPEFPYKTPNFLTEWALFLRGFVLLQSSLLLCVK
jgi:hypothetical protein